MRWLNAQLHNHTVHSDGRDTVSQMIDKLSARGAELLAITDHNAVSGIPEFLQHCKEKGVVGIRGNEISSYYGHVVGLGLEEYYDWRYCDPKDPEAVFDFIHARGGLCGYAHPIRIGFPFVPSCSWLYKIHDYNKVDYYEILNTGDWWRSRNDLVLEEWIERLREGFLHLGATSALDYHARPFHGHEYVTYVALDMEKPDLEKEAMAAIKGQRMIVCKDAFVDISLKDEAGKTYIPGDCLEGRAKLLVKPDPSYGDLENLVFVLDDQNGTREVKGSAEMDVEFFKFLVVRVYKEKKDFFNLIAVSNPFKEKV